jgi:hypothetical protein
MHFFSKKMARLHFNPSKERSDCELPAVYYGLCTPHTQRGITRIDFESGLA